MKKKKKGLWAVFSFIFIINFAVFGPGLLNSQPEGGEYEEGVLRVWVTWGDDRDQLQPFFDRYSEATGQAVKVAARVRSDRLEQELASSTPPDVVILSTNDLVGFYQQKGLIQPMNAWIDSTGINLAELYPAPLAQCQMPDGTLQCLPWIGDTFALYWNKDLFAAAGLDPERPPQTMEEMLEYALLLTVPGDQGFRQVGFIPDYPRPHLDVYAHMFGGSWYGSAGAELSANSQAVIDALNWQRQFYSQIGFSQGSEFISSVDRYRSSKHPVAAGMRLNCQQCHRFIPSNANKMPDQGFYNGQIAMMVDGTWNLGTNYIEAYAPDLNYGVAPIPAAAEHLDFASTSVFQGPVIVVPSGALNIKSTADLLAWMMLPENVAEIAQAASSLPANRIAAQDLRFQNIPGLQVFLDLMSADGTFAAPSTPINNEINKALAKIEKDLLQAEGSNISPLLNNLQAEYGPILEGIVSSR